MSNFFLHFGQKPVFLVKPAPVLLWIICLFSFTFNSVLLLSQNSILCCSFKTGQHAGKRLAIWGRTGFYPSRNLTESHLSLHCAYDTPCNSFQLGSDPVTHKAMSNRGRQNGKPDGGPIFLEGQKDKHKKGRRGKKKKNKPQIVFKKKLKKRDLPFWCSC